MGDLKESIKVRWDLGNPTQNARSCCPFVQGHENQGNEGEREAPIMAARVRVRSVVLCVMCARVSMSLTVYKKTCWARMGILGVIRYWAHPLDKYLIKSISSWLNILSIEYYFVPLNNNIGLPSKSSNYE